VVTDHGAYERVGPTTPRAAQAGSPAPAPAPPVARPAALQLAARFARAIRPRLRRRRGVYTLFTGVRAGCRSGGAACIATSVATLVPERAGRSAQRRRAVRLGSARQRIAAGRRAEIRLRLNRGAIRRIMRSRRLRMRVAITMRKPGAANATRTRTIVIRLPRRR
jgi:hypothetical protein